MLRRGPIGAVLFGLALLVKTWALVAACPMLGQAADSLGYGLHCSLNTGADPTPGDGSPRHDHCPLCQIVSAGPALFEARSVGGAAPYAEARAFFWTIAPGRTTHFGGDQHRPPRGPPFLT